jgi:hypothetical protein
LRLRNLAVDMLVEQFGGALSCHAARPPRFDAKDAMLPYVRATCVAAASVT